MATSYVAANGRKLEFRVKKCGNISKDSASGISLDEFQLQRRVSKKKFKTVLTLELDSDSSTQAAIDKLYRNPSALQLLVRVVCANKEVSVSPYFECVNEGWVWSATKKQPAEDFDEEALEQVEGPAPPRVE